MGLINHDQLALSNGLSVIDTYMCISSNSIRISKISSENYLVNVGYVIFYNQDAKNNNKQPINNLGFDFTIVENDLAQNIYILSYDQLKIMYPNYSDC